MKDDTHMRPLMEILEEERMLMLKLNSVERLISKHFDSDTIEIASEQRVAISRKLDNVRNELRDYIEELFK